VETYIRSTNTFNLLVRSTLDVTSQLTCTFTFQDATKKYEKEVFALQGKGRKFWGDCIKEFLEKGREVGNYINPYFDKNATSETKFIKRRIKILKLLLESSHV